VTKQLWITDKINGLLDKKLKPGIKKEGLAHAILLLGLTDKDFLSRALELHDYLDKGAEALDKMGL